MTSVDAFKRNSLKKLNKWVDKHGIEDDIRQNISIRKQSFI